MYLNQPTETFYNMKILPTLLLVEDHKETESKTESGILIPVTTKTNQMKGKVMFCGKGTSELEMIYEVGDMVIYKPNSGREVEVEDKKLRLLDIREILFGL